VWTDRRGGDVEQIWTGRPCGLGNIIGALAEKQVQKLLAASEHERRSMIRKEESLRCGSSATPSRAASQSSHPIS
jgi:hypothetical protein